MRRSSVLAWSLAVLAVLCGIAAVVLAALANEHADPWWQNALGFGAVVASAAIGLLVTTRRDGHPVGWLLIANALILATIGASSAYAQYAILEDPDALPGAEWAVLWEQSSWPLLFGVIASLALVFPEGRLISPRWRRVALAMGAAVGIFLILSFFDPEPFEAPYEDVDRPLPELPDALAMLWPVAMLGMLVGLVGAMWALRIRFRSATGVERLQLKWLAYSALLVPAALVICVLGAILADGVEDDDAFNALFFFMIAAVPVSVGVAVLRYRLYEIDRIINRTLVYGVLTLLLAGAYAVTTLVLGTALGRGSAWATAGATLAAAAAFRPLRARVQDVVDRRFSRARFDARRRIEAFMEELRAGQAPPEAVETVLREVLADPSLELHFWLPESEVYVDSLGRPVGESEAGARERTPIERAGAPLGMVIHAAPPERRGLVEEAVAAAGLAIEIARLRVELRRQLEEVEASRARIVAAGYAERRRIERDLHDGAQQRLVSIGLQLRHVQHELGRDGGAPASALDAPVEELRQALDDLRDLARGVRPAQLDEGLGPALRELADRSPIPVEVRAAPERFPDDVEAAAYFIACEAVTNAVKHARASRVEVTAERMNGRLVVSIEDDGVGGASDARGSGLRGLADRTDAHEGTLRVESPEGSGTLIVAELPCAS